MKFCNKCGNVQSDHSNFCIICGSPLEKESTTKDLNHECEDRFTLDRSTNLRKYIISIALYFGFFYIFSAVFQTIYTVVWLASNNVSADQLLNDSLVYEAYYISTLSWSNLATYLAATLSIVPLLFNTLKKDIIDYGKDLSESLTWTFAGIGLLYGGVFTGNIIVKILTFGLKASGNSENQEAINKIMSSGGFNLFSIGFITIVIAPILEELIFRKALFGLFKKSTIKTVILSAIIFASIHVVPACLTLLVDVLSNGGSITDLYVEAVYIFSYIGQGFALSYVYYKTKGNIVPCIIIHFVNNLIAFIANMYILG